MIQVLHPFVWYRGISSDFDGAIKEKCSWSMIHHDSYLLPNHYSFCLDPFPHQRAWRSINSSRLCCLSGWKSCKWKLAELQLYHPKFFICLFIFTILIQIKNSRRAQDWREFLFLFIKEIFLFSFTRITLWNLIRIDWDILCIPTFLSISLLFFIFMECQFSFYAYIIS